jgi:hypothetical protein
MTPTEKDWRMDMQPHSHKKHKRIFFVWVGARKEGNCRMNKKNGSQNFTATILSKH